MEPHFAPDLDQVFVRARDAGVTKMINVGCTIKASKQSLDMALKHDFLWATQGLHPSDFRDFSEDLMRDFYDVAKKNSKVVAIGECGLDYHYPQYDREKQMLSLRAQMRLAQELSLPVILHCRDSERTKKDASVDMLAVLKEFPRVRFLLHCFAQDMEYAQEALKGDCLFSFGGTLTYPAAEEIRKVAAFLPADRLVLETDGPYLPPQTKRGQRNEPAFILEAAQKMALIRRVSLEAVSAFTTKNAERFFGI